MRSARVTSLVLTLLVSLLAAIAVAKPNAEWFRHAAVSPDGESILFAHKGNIWRVPAAGGLATPLTMHDGWEGFPVWSKDSKHVAFASDRHGNLDIFLMPASGGKATRITYHSNNDIPTDFSPDGKNILFNASRMDAAESSLFPNGSLNELYEVSVSGGTPRMLSTTSASEARYSPDGERVLYREEKAMESRLRKHDTSAFAHDIWLLDLQNGEHTQLSSFAGGDHTPIWNGPDNIFYLTEQDSGTFNAWSMNLETGATAQVSDFKDHPVRSLSLAQDGTLVLTHHGSIYTLRDGKSERVRVTFPAAIADNESQNLNVTGQITEFAVSPNGKEVAFVARGEVFVTSTDFATTKRVTNTAEQERSVSFHKDGRTLLYTSSRDGMWKLYESSIVDDQEKYFFAATSLQEELLYSAKTESYQPKYSPDGNKVAFLAGRDEIQVVDRSSKDVNVALAKVYNYSYADGDIEFEWSPDSKWLVASYAPRGRLFILNIGVFPADGSAEPIDVSRSGYLDGSPHWGKSGDVIYWNSSRHGMRAHGSWGRQYDVVAAFLTQAAFDKHTMSKEEFQLMTELKEEKEKEDKKKDDEEQDEEAEDADDEEAEIVEEIEIEWDNLTDRSVRLTRHSSNLGSTALTKDGTKLYYASRFEKGFDIWVQDFKEGTTRLALKLGASAVQIALSADDESLFILADRKLSKAAVGDKLESKGISASAMMELRPEAERAHMFEHAWRKLADKFYEPDMHGVDWDFMKEEYAAKLPGINNNRDLGQMMEELMGELNASHTGTYYTHRDGQADATAGLGLILNLRDTSGPLAINEVLDQSPLKKANSEIRAGMLLAAIDGVRLDGKSNLAHLLNNKVGKRVRLTITRKDGTSFEEVTKPLNLTAESNLVYERWVKNRRALVEELSDGRIGYVHVRGMADASYRVIYSEILGMNFDKEAIIVDTRWNGGGWLHNDLAKLLSGQNYLNLKVRGRLYSGEPMDQWYKPSLIVVGEGNYSDAHTFPFTYKALDIGDVVGMPVPGTSTSVWWETMISGDLTFGVPQVGNLNIAGEYLENREVTPDYLVKNDPQSSAAGQDKQIEKAVEVMLQTLAESR